MGVRYNNATAMTNPTPIRMPPLRAISNKAINGKMYTVSPKTVEMIRVMLICCSFLTISVWGFMGCCAWDVSIF